MKYQVGTVLPWWIKTYLLRRKVGECPRLYHFDGHVENDDEFAEKIRKESNAMSGGRRQSAVGKFTNKF